MSAPARVTASLSRTPGEHRVLGDISVTNSSASGGMLARLGEWGLGWEHEETLSASDIMTGSTKHHGYKVRLTSSAPCHIVTQLLCKQQTTLIICQNQTFLLLGQNNAQPTNNIFGFNFNLSMDKESVECR